MFFHPYSINNFQNLCVTQLVISFSTPLLGVQGVVATAFFTIPAILAAFVLILKGLEIGTKNPQEKESFCKWFKAVYGGLIGSFLMSLFGTSTIGQNPFIQGGLGIGLSVYTGETAQCAGT